MGLIEGTLASEDVPAAVEKLMKISKKFSFDASMLTAVQTALSKLPSARGPFDMCVVTQYSDAIKQEVEKFASAILSAEPTKAKLNAELKLAEKAVADAMLGLKSSAGVFEKKQAAKEASEKAASDAKQECKGLLAQHRRSTKDETAAVAEMELFRDGPIAAFEDSRALAVPAEDTTGEVPAPPNDAAAVSADAMCGTA